MLSIRPQKWISALLMIGIGLAAAPAYAQETTDPALLEVVQQALEQTRTLTSLHIETQQQTEMTLGAGFTLDQQGASSFDLVQNADTWNAQGTQTTTLALPTGESEFTIESVILDGQTYLRFEGTPTFPGQNTEGQTLPEGWFDAAQLAEDQTLPQVGVLLDSEAQITAAFGTLLLPVDADSVTALSEIDSDTIDGQNMRVFQLTLSPQAVIDSDSASLLSLGGGIGGMDAGAGGFPGGQAGDAPQFTPPADMPEMPELNGTPEPINPEDVQITYAIYVGEDDGFVHRIYSVIALAATDASPMTANITTITDFSAFDEPVTITAPELAS